MTPPPGRRWSGARDPSERALLYVPDYLTAPARAAIEAWLATLTPLWEQRYSTVRPLPPGRAQRPLLRPVYWLGNWQFACLGYYEPPHGVRDRSVLAEALPPPPPRATNWNSARSPIDSEATGPGSKSRWSPTRATSTQRVPSWRSP